MRCKSIYDRWKSDEEYYINDHIKKAVYSIVYGCIAAGCSKNNTQKISENKYSPFIEKLLHFLSSPKETVIEDEISSLSIAARLLFEIRKTFDFSVHVHIIEEKLVPMNFSDSMIFACIFFTEYLFRLYNYDDFEHALIHTVKLCMDVLGTSRYECYLARYKNLLDGSFEKKSREEFYDISDINQILEICIWSCFHSNTFESCICIASDFSEISEVICPITGVMAGLFYGIESFSIDEMKNSKLEINGIIDSFVETVKKI